MLTWPVMATTMGEHMITGDDSRHRAALLLADPPASEQGLRIPCRITSGDRVLEGEAVIDTGAAQSVVASELGLPKNGDTDTGVCACNHAIEVSRVDAVLHIDGIEIRNPISTPLNSLGVVAIVGLDILQKCSLTYANGKFTLERTQ